MSLLPYQSNIVRIRSGEGRRTDVQEEDLFRRGACSVHGCLLRRHAMEMVRLFLFYTVHTERYAVESSLLNALPILVPEIRRCVFKVET